MNKLVLCCLSMIFVSACQTNDLYVNFPSISVRELIKFVSKAARINFIVKDDLLDFNISFIAGREISREELLNLFIYTLENFNLEVKEESGNYIICENNHGESARLSARRGNGKFSVYKLKYHRGEEILPIIKDISRELVSTKSGDIDMVITIDSMQFMRATNSLVFSGDEKTISSVERMISQLDSPLKQVFIEILVVETTLSNSLDFGIKWISKDSNGKSFITGGFDDRGSPVHSLGNITEIGPKSGLSLGIIGDVILHKKIPFDSIGALVSMIEHNSDCSIVLNQKIVAQENKPSHVFVGDNIPCYTGLGSDDNKFPNRRVEYKDVGVSLNITPLLGDNDVVTLDISEEITEATEHLMWSSDGLGGIKTSKTNMQTSVHLPDGKFLILSGITKKNHSKDRASPPCLGAIPLIGKLMSRSKDSHEKKNLLIFVRPRIIKSDDNYINITENQGFKVEKMSK